RAFTIPNLPFAAHIKRLDRQTISSASSIVTSTVYSPTSSQEQLDRLGAELSMSFMSVLDEMYQTMRVRAQHEAAASTEAKTPESKAGVVTPNYNVVMTLEHIYLFPRSAEKFILRSSPEAPNTTTNTSTTALLTLPQLDGVPDDEPFLSLSINSLGFGGMLLVKSNQELERVKSVGIGRILSTVGMEPLKEEDNKGCDDVFADLA
ncbi:bifunctional AP-4-A phosphorylase/ADP sulfurylase, partial [Serendipita sp. 399]